MGHSDGSDNTGRAHYQRKFTNTVFDSVWAPWVVLSVCLNLKHFVPAAFVAPLFVNLSHPVSNPSTFTRLHAPSPTAAVKCVLHVPKTQHQNYHINDVKIQGFHQACHRRY